MTDDKITADDLKDDTFDAHLDKVLEDGEPAPGVDMDELLDEVSTLLLATGGILHMRSHDFVEPHQVRQDVEMFLHSLGHLLYRLSQ